MYRPPATHSASRVPETSSCNRLAAGTDSTSRASSTAVVIPWRATSGSVTRDTTAASRVSGKRALVVNREHDADPAVALADAFSAANRQLTTLEAAKHPG